MLENSQPSIQITVCLGSSCFSRGNKMLLREVDDFISANHLEKKVLVKGAHCLNLCGQGPILIIQDKTFEKVDYKTVKELLNNHLKFAEDGSSSLHNK